MIVYTPFSLQAQQDRIQREQQMEQEERITNRLQQLKLETQRQEKVRQQIRENSLELRELEAKLRAGYMNRERAAQIAEKEASKYEKTVSWKIYELLHVYLYLSVFWLLNAYWCSQIINTILFCMHWQIGIEGVNSKLTLKQCS